jgi:hypothetical protein
MKFLLELTIREKQHIMDTNTTNIQIKVTYEQREKRYLQIEWETIEYVN